MFTKKNNTKNDAKSKNASPEQTSEQNSCCQPVKTANHPPVPTASHSSHTSHSGTKGTSKTRVTIKYDVGFSNQVYIRGKGANLSWDKGQPLKNVKADEWIWETDVPFTQCEFKVLINDRVYENGNNHQLSGGSTIVYTPRFF